MHIIVDTKHLKQRLDWATAVIPGRPTIPIMVGVKIAATDDGRIELTTSDYEIWCTSSMGADVDTPGSVIVPGRALAEVIKYIKTDTVTLEADGGALKVSGGTVKASLTTLPVEDYPNTPDAGIEYGTVEASALSGVIQGVSGFAAHGDATLAELSCIHLALEEDAILGTATDRYQVGRRWVEWKPTRDIPEGLIVGTPIGSLTRLVRDFTGDVTLALSRFQGDEAGSVNGISLADDTHRVLLNTIDVGPQISKVVEKEQAAERESLFTVNRKALIEALSLASVFKEGQMMKVQMGFAPDNEGDDGEGVDGTLSVDGASGTQGGSTQDLPVKMTGTPMKVTFNATLLSKALGHIPGQEVRVELRNPTAPVVVYGLDDDGVSEGGAYVVMPLRT